MEKKSKLNLKILLLVVIIAVVAASVIGAIVVVNIVNNGVDHNSGIFTMEFVTRTSDQWTVSAQSARGYSIIFRDLSQQDLNQISVDSSIAEGEMSLILSQGEHSQTIDLSGGAKNLSADDMGMDMFSPGRISMQLKFNNAKNIAVNINWR